MPTPEKFPRDFLRIFLNSNFNNPHISESDMQAGRRAFIENPELRTAVLATFEEVLLEDPKSYLEKYRFWAGDAADTEAEAEAMLRSIWEIVSKGEQPFPLDTV